MNIDKNNYNTGEKTFIIDKLLKKIISHLTKKGSLKVVDYKNISTPGISNYELLIEFELQKIKYLIEFSYFYMTGGSISRCVTMISADSKKPIFKFKLRDFVQKPYKRRRELFDVILNYKKDMEEEKEEKEEKVTLEPLLSVFHYQESNEIKKD